MANTPYQTTGPTGNGNISHLSFSYDAADISAAAMLTAFPIPNAFKLLGIRIVVTKATTGTGATATITAKINTTTVTGLSVTPTLATTATQGLVISDLATDVLSGGNNVGAAGDTITLTAGTVTAAFTAGKFEVCLILQSLD